MIFDENICAEHLSGMLKYKTVSDKNMDHMDFGEFDRFHEYLEKTYPLVHQHLKREIIGKAGLLYTWKGSGKSRNLPVMLIAHQDVVPAGDEKRWTYPPYEGRIDKNRVWGRGANDCKGVMMAHLEAAEALLREGFVPDYDIYLGYGYTEEVAGPGAAEICETLRNRGVRIGLLIDEGSGVCQGYREGLNRDFVYIKLNEKGSAGFKIVVHGKGGHTMNAGGRSIIAVAGQIANDLQNNPLPWKVIDCVEEEYKMKAPYFKENGSLFENPKENIEQIRTLLEKKPRESAKFTTSMSILSIHSYPEAGSMPTEVELKVSFRVLPGDTAEDLQKYLEKIVAGRGDVIKIYGEDPSPTSRSDSGSYHLVKDTYEKLYPGVLVIPCIGIGGTDARNYYSISDCIYRCTGFPYSADGISVNLHNFDENMFVPDLNKGPQFFYELLTNYADYDNVQ